MMSNFYVYIIVDKTSCYNYVGKTNNLKRRLSEHNQGKHISTKAHRPWRIIYTEEFFSEEKARDREKYLKSGSGREFKELIIK